MANMSDRELKLRAQALELGLLSSICAELQIRLLPNAENEMETVLTAIDNKIAEEQGKP